MMSDIQRQYSARTIAYAVIIASIELEESSPEPSGLAKRSRRAPVRFNAGPASGKLNGDDVVFRSAKRKKGTKRSAASAKMAKERKETKRSAVSAKIAKERKVKTTQAVGVTFPGVRSDRELARALFYGLRCAPQSP